MSDEIVVPPGFPAPAPAPSEGMEKLDGKGAALPLEQLKGVIEKTFTSTSRFSAGKVRAADGALHGFRGKCMVREGDPVILHGTWVYDPKFGQQFDVKRFDFDSKPSMDGLANYLAKSAAGIGPSKAKKIAERFGDDFMRALKEEPEKIAEVAGVPLARIEEMQKDWASKEDTIRAKLYLAGIGLTEKAIDVLSKRYGSSVITLLKDDPFELAREVKGYGFSRADEIAQKLGVPANHPGRIAAGLTHTIDKHLDDGHTWTGFVDLIDGACSLLKTSDRTVVEQRLESLVMQGKRLHSRPVNQWGVHGLARPDVFNDELNVGRRLYAVAPSRHFNAYEAQQIADGIADLNSGQRAAVMLALAWNMVVVTGPGGTGKTHVMGKIVTACEAKGLKVVLCAPTGKAAKRMEQLSGREAQTIHRMLGLGKEDDFGDRTGTGELSADIVLVDEASMIDVWLFARLFEAIDPARTSVVFFGDHHQLPPVGPGNVLRDLVERRPIPVVTLTEVVRQAGILKENSTAVLVGQVRPSAPHKVEEGKVVAPWVVDARYERALDLQKRVVTLWDTLPGKLGVEPTDIQILAPVYKGPCGIDLLNAIIQRKVQGARGVTVAEWSGSPKNEGGEDEDRKVRSRPQFYESDRVIWTKNDYDLGVMNGTQGVVVHRYDDGSLDVDFGYDEPVAVGRGDAHKLELAYALSVHRAQGDQWPVVVSVIHSTQGFMLNRALFYTMVTRASRAVVLVGDWKGMQQAAAKEEASKRRTWLSVLELRRWG